MRLFFPEAANLSIPNNVNTRLLFINTASRHSVKWFSLQLFPIENQTPNNNNLPHLEIYFAGEFFAPTLPTAQPEQPTNSFTPQYQITMADRDDRKPTTFLSLPREIRQKILIHSIQPEITQQDIQFNKRLLTLDNNIMALILSYTSGTETHLPTTSEETDKKTFTNFRAAVHNLRNYGIIPVHTVTHAENLSSIHPSIREDIPWVLRNWFALLLVRFLASLSPKPVHRESVRRQSIYVSEPFGGWRRVDKFTKQGLKSSKAYRIASRKAINTSNAEWNSTGLKLLDGQFRKYGPNVKNFVA